MKFSILNLKYFAFFVRASSIEPIVKVSAMDEVKNPYNYSTILELKGDPHIYAGITKTTVDIRTGGGQNYGMPKTL